MRAMTAAPAGIFSGGDPHDGPMPLDCCAGRATALSRSASIQGDSRPRLLVLRRYPAPKPDLEGVAVRLDVDPRQ
jgi:hypothetical protein